ncbi:hypothetical protein [Vibrio alginolyticus]|uniref:hypothetical protein n=1 Tax=Vibrio alginolyticus TaxID=663 RepID=UPI003D647033
MAEYSYQVLLIWLGIKRKSADFARNVLLFFLWLIGCAGLGLRRDVLLYVAQKRFIAERDIFLLRQVLPNGFEVISGLNAFFDEGLNANESRKDFLFGGRASFGLALNNPGLQLFDVIRHIKPPYCPG